MCVCTHTYQLCRSSWPFQDSWILHCSLLAHTVMLSVFLVVKNMELYKRNEINFVVDAFIQLSVNMRQKVLNLLHEISRRVR